MLGTIGESRSVSEAFDTFEAIEAYLSRLHIRYHITKEDGRRYNEEEEY